VIPVDSPAVPIDAKPAKGKARPVRKLQIAQTLDERQAEQGKLILEVKATGLGLVPELDQLVTLLPGEFDVKSTDDQGVSVSKFDPDGDETAVVSERTWMITFQAKPNLPERPKAFRFAGAKIDGSELTFHRYKDADLVAVSQDISLEEKYGEPSRAWLWTAVAVGILAIALAVLAYRLARRPATIDADELKLPDNLTPFNVIGLLRRIEQTNGFNEAQKIELGRSIDRLERHFFSGDANGELDLKEIAESWLRKTK
jgi:hypothetical protein